MKATILTGFALMFDEDDQEPMFVKDRGTGAPETPPEFDGIVEPASMVLGDDTATKGLLAAIHRAHKAEHKLASILLSAQHSAGKVINDTAIKRIIDAP